LDRTHSNERLEFLGDRVLGLSVAHMLYERFETEDEGPLARRFAGLTSRDALAQVAASLNLKDFIRTQSGDAETEERSQSSITADTLEAVLGAIYLDGGLDPAWAFIAKNWEHLIDKDLSAPKDAKTALQEWAQARNLGLPSYEVVDREGPDHAPTFTVCVTVKGHAPQFGQSNSRRSAEQDAAQKLLTKLET
jgi:ribonuclease-3